MNLLEKTKNISKIYNIIPSRSKGQNFLISENIYDKIVGIAEIKKEDTVLEVGPGLGFLTAKLVRAAKEVIAVELDDKIFSFLRDALSSSDLNNLKLVNSDILKLKIEDFVSKFKIVANLPYNITSIFLRKFLSENKIKPEMTVLMLQKEVAKRICAKAGDMSLLSLSIQFYADVEIAMEVGRENFWPSPEVDSAIIKIKLKKELPGVDEKSFFQIAKFGFSAKRKMLKNNLAAGLRIKNDEAEKMIMQIGLDQKIRAEDLSVEDWINLAKNTKKYK